MPEGAIVKLRCLDGTAIGVVGRIPGTQQTTTRFKKREYVWVVGRGLWQVRRMEVVECAQHRNMVRHGAVTTGRCSALCAVAGCK